MRMDEDVCACKDCAGNDLVKGGLTSSSATDCCQHCQKTKGCQYWTQAKNENTCWVKSSAAGSQKQSDRESGSLVTTANNTCAKSTDLGSTPPTVAPSVSFCTTDCIENGVDYQGACHAIAVLLRMHTSCVMIARWMDRDA